MQGQLVHAADEGGVAPGAGVAQQRQEAVRPDEALITASVVCPVLSDLLFLNLRRKLASLPTAPDSGGCGRDQAAVVLGGFAPAQVEGVVGIQEGAVASAEP